MVTNQTRAWMIVILQVIPATIVPEQHDIIYTMFFMLLSVSIPTRGILAARYTLP